MRGASGNLRHALSTSGGRAGIGGPRGAKARVLEDVLRILPGSTPEAASQGPWAPPARLMLGRRRRAFARARVFA